MRTLDGKSSILQCSGFQSKACTEFSAQTAPKLLVLCARNIAGACFVSESGRRSRGSRGSRPSALLTQSVRLHSAVECSQKNGGAHRLKLAGIFGCNRPPAPIPVSAQPEALPCSQRFNLEIPSPKVPRRASLHSVGRTFAQGLHAVARRDRAAGGLHGYPDDQLAVAMHAEDMHLGAQTTQPISNHSRTQSPQSMPTAWQFTNRGCR